MRPNQILVAKACPEQNTILLTYFLAYAAHVRFLGASVPVSVVAGESVNRSLSIEAPKGKTGIVALYVRYFPDGKNVQSREHSFLLKVTNEEGKGPNVDLEYEWQPLSGRLGQASDNSVSVIIGDRRFIGSEYPKYSGQDSGWYCDPNLICRYLAGEVEADEVKVAAKEFRKDEPMLAQKEQKELLAEVEWLKKELAAEHAARVAAEGSERSIGERCMRAYKESTHLAQECRKLLEITDLFFSGTHWHWFKSDALKRALRMYAAFLKDKDGILVTK